LFLETTLSWEKLVLQMVVFIYVAAGVIGTHGAGFFAVSYFGEFYARCIVDVLYFSAPETSSGQAAFQNYLLWQI
jgi:hypothetical protein